MTFFPYYILNDTFAPWDPRGDPLAHSSSAKEFLVSLPLRFARPPLGGLSGRPGSAPLSPLTIRVRKPAPPPLRQIIMVVSIVVYPAGNQLALPTSSLARSISEVNSSDYLKFYFFNITFHFTMSKQEIKEKCNAYKAMIMAEAKFIETKDQYYQLNR